MSRNGKIVPSSKAAEKGQMPSSEDPTVMPPEPKVRKKSFVRVAPKKSAPSQGKGRKKEAVVEPEVLDVEDEDELEDEELDEGDIIDVGPDELEARTGELLAGDEDDDRRLPVLRGEVLPAEEEEETSVPEERGLVLSTGLSRYLAEIRKYNLLTPEEERQAAFAAYEKGDVEARNKLVTSNLRLVVKIAMEYRRAYSQILDLIQEGNAGLVQAVNRFNPYRGVRLSTYSAWWIRAYILKFLMDNKSLVRMGTTDAQRKLFFRLRSEAERMYALTQRFDAHLLAESIGVKEQDVVEMQQRLTKSDVSLDAPLGEEGEARQVDNLASSFDDPEASSEKSELIRLLREGIREVEKELNERDLFIFRNRIIADDPITLQDVGEKFGITRERARQLEARVLKKIKEKLAERGVTGD